MPDLDLDDGADPQDGAEAFDETNRQDGLLLDSDDEGDEPDIAPDVYDVTTAIGDADGDDGVQYELDAADGVENLDGDDLEDDEDDDESLDDGFEDDPEDDDIDDDDDAVDVIAGRAAPSEPGLLYVADVDPSTHPRDDEAEKYESTRPLSDAQLSDLGYGDRKTDNKEDSAMDANKPEQPKARPDIWEERSFGEETNDELIEGTGATAEDVEDESDPDEEDRLDEGLEETFPASDPVSAKHIT